MNRNFSLLVLIISILVLNTCAAYEDDEYYCKRGKDFNICQRCSDLESDCPRKTEEDCRCDNIAIKDIDKWIGGVCEEGFDEYDEPETKGCYVSENSNCE